MLLKACAFLLVVVLCGKALSAPLFFGSPQLVTNFLASASAPITSLRQTQDPNFDDDDFFKDPEEAQQTATTPPGFFQQKFEKIVRKLQILSTLTGSGSTTPRTNEDDDFDRDFNEDFTKETENLQARKGGYFYNKPSQAAERSGKQQQANAKQDGFNPSDIGVFLVELIGSLAGLVYGATAQLNYQGGTTTAATPI